MASAALLGEFRDINKGILARAEADLEVFYASLDLTDIARAREQLIDFMLALVESYGRTSALTAAQFYDALRSASPNATGTYRAILGGNVTRVEIDGTVRWAVDGLLKGDEGSTLSRLSGAAQRYITNQGRDTIALNSYRDPSPGRWARVPSGPTTCGFCLSLASRGPVSRSEATARTASDGTAYHDRCDCQPVQIWTGDDLPDGYDPDALYVEYKAARDETGSGSLDVIAARLDAERPR